MSGYLSLEGLQHFWSKVKSYIDNKLSNASNKEENITYSTEEHIVGTWIDGRPVYEKTFSLNGGYFSGTPRMASITIASNFNYTIVDARGYIDPFSVKGPGSSYYDGYALVVPSSLVSIVKDNYSNVRVISFDYPNEDNANTTITFYVNYVITLQYIK